MSRRPAGLRLAAGLVLLLVATSWSEAKEARRYSISLEVRYGDVPSRSSYLDDLRRAIGSWLASTGPFGAPVEEGEADLHLRILFQKIEVNRRYPAVSNETDVLFDSARRPTQTFSTLFETEMTLVDPRQDHQTIVTKRLSVFNEQSYTEFITDPRQHSWDVNVEFFLDRLGSFLQKKRKKILRHLDEHPRGAAAAGLR